MHNHHTYATIMQQHVMAEMIAAMASVVKARVIVMQTVIAFPAWNATSIGGGEMIGA